MWQSTLSLKMLSSLVASKGEGRHLARKKKRGVSFSLHLIKRRAFLTNQGFLIAKELPQWMSLEQKFCPFTSFVLSSSSLASWPGNLNRWSQCSKSRVLISRLSLQEVQAILISEANTPDSRNFIQYVSSQPCLFFQDYPHLLSVRKLGLRKCASN